jgi:hypothetical protein
MLFVRPHRLTASTYHQLTKCNLTNLYPTYPSPCNAFTGVYFEGIQYTSRCMERMLEVFVAVIAAVQNEKERKGQSI